MLNGLDLFSGIGGLSLALSEWVRPVTYVEIDAYCQCVLAARMREGRLASAPVWDDVRSFDGLPLRGVVDVIYGGFPCQDISVAGDGKGMAGERSGLFFEIVRLAQEIKPALLFLENVPAIRTRGLPVVARELAALRYDLRWGTLSAYDVGAPHKRDRWWLLAYRNGDGRKGLAQRDGEGQEGRGAFGDDADGLRDVVPDAERLKLRDEQGRLGGTSGAGAPVVEHDGWWRSEPDVGRVAHGVPKRMDRLRGLGNAVVPAQAREAFIRLSGVTA